MAINSLEIVQSNIEGSVNAMAVHSPLVFLVDADYSGTPPDFIYAELLLAGESLIIVRCIYVTDISANVRRFKFTADEILRSYMPLFDDMVQSGGSQIIATNLSREFTIVFRSDFQGTIQETIEIDAIHAARQIGQSANLSDMALNANEVYIGCPNKPVYVYFYNTEAGEEPPQNLVFALDYDDEPFTDYVDTEFEVPNFL